MRRLNTLMIDDTSKATKAVDRKLKRTKKYVCIVAYVKRTAYFNGSLLLLLEKKRKSKPLT